MFLSLYRVSSLIKNTLSAITTNFVTFWPFWSELRGHLFSQNFQINNGFVPKQATSPFQKHSLNYRWIDMGRISNQPLPLLTRMQSRQFLHWQEAERVRRGMCLYSKRYGAMRWCTLWEVSDSTCPMNQDMDYLWVLFLLILHQGYFIFCRASGLGIFQPCYAVVSLMFYLTGKGIQWDF